MRSRARTIAIIGGGFSGTVLAVNLLRRVAQVPTRIVLIEQRAEVGRGVAYQNHWYPHLLNVPAARMSAQPAEPLQFLRFAQSRDASCHAEQFLPRRLYGEYLQDLLQQAVEAAPEHVSLKRIQAQAESLYRIDSIGPYLVSLSNQQRILADDVVLACGDPPPSSPSAAAALAGHPAYVCDPFRDAALRPEAQTMLLIGTGLTMVDIAIAAASLNPALRIHAISRHGLLPAAQTEGNASALVGDLMSRIQPGVVSARRVLRAFRTLLSDIECRAGDWRDAINMARHCAPETWQAMPVRERARFLRHLRAHWVVHRHRMPPTSDAELTRLRQSGQLTIHAGHLLPLAANEDGSIGVSWRERGGGGISSLSVDRVINCTGADQRLSQTQEPLLQGLIAGGLAVADPLGLGWHTGELGALIDRDGVPAEHLFYLGPMLRAEHWEATAVGELRAHADRLARTLTDRSTSCTSPQP